jgi:glycosyltransferase 2 family protein
LVAFGVRFDFSSAWQALLGIRLSNLWLASAAFLLNLLIKAIRWHRMARQLSISVPLPVSIAAFFSGCFWGLLTIGRIGEFYRAEALFGRAPSKMVALATCITDRLIDVAFLAYLAAALSTLIFLPWSVASRVTLVGVATVVLALVFVGLARLTRRRAKIAVPSPTEERRSPRWWLASREQIAPLLVASRDLVFEWRMAETLALTAVSWAAYFLAIHWLALGLGIRAPFSVTCVASALAAIAAALPISFQGLGTRDATFVLVFGAVGITTTQSMTLSLSALALFYLVSIPTGGAAVAWRRRQRASTADVARAAAPR